MSDEFAGTARMVSIYGRKYNQRHFFRNKFIRAELFTWTTTTTTYKPVTDFYVEVSWLPFHPPGYHGSYLRGE